MMRVLPVQSKVSLWCRPHEKPEIPLGSPHSPSPWIHYLETSVSLSPSMVLSSPRPRLQAGESLLTPEEQGLHLSRN